ncbi:efflux RND transporter periplasmic adaptor subunit [Emticicia soli]|uniref:Efflux RND transporter periplasmic adaptor subunit n=1 Tax=Emticicia soli TaxID=2027878 RepID=A0ABW5JAA4_9BACT
MKIYFFISILSVSILVSCSKKAESNNTVSASADSTSTVNTQTQQIKITAEQFKNLGVELGNFTEIPMNNEIKVAGTVEVPPENQVSLSIPITGFVKTILPNNALQGWFVKKGTVLATIESIEFIQLQQDYFQAVAHSVFLEKELERQQTLSAEDIGVKKKLQQADAEFNSNQALIKALEAKLKVLGITASTLKRGDISPVINVVSPITGFVKNAPINIGKSVTPNDILFELINRDDLHIQLKVLEKDASKIQKGQKILIEDKRLGDNAYATVFLVGQAFEDETKALNIHAHLDNRQLEQKLTPGMFINARIFTGTHVAKALPESAILRESIGNFIIALENQNDKEVVFKKIPVKLGTTQGANIEVELPGNAGNVVSVVINKAHFLSGMSGTDEE